MLDKIKAETINSSLILFHLTYNIRTAQIMYCLNHYVLRRMLLVLAVYVFDCLFSQINDELYNKRLLSLQA